MLLVRPLLTFGILVLASLSCKRKELRRGEGIEEDGVENTTRNTTEPDHSHAYLL